MVILELKKHRENFEVNLFERKGSKSHYQNILNRNPNQFAQILIDLYLDGFPVETAVKIFLRRIKSKDWIGL